MPSSEAEEEPAEHRALEEGRAAVGAPGDEPGRQQEVEGHEHEADGGADRAVDTAEQAADEDHERADDERVPGHVAGDAALVGHGGDGRGHQDPRRFHGLSASCRSMAALYR
jgi:hypothetical protein